MSLLSLPSETMVAIMSYLPVRDKLHIRMTCRQLYSVTSDPIFWSTILWQYYNPTCEEKPLKTALKLGAPLLERLDVSAVDRFALSKFRPVLKSCESLKYVTLTGFRLSSDQLKSLLTILPNIYHFEYNESFRCPVQKFFELAPLSVSLQSVIFNKICYVGDVLRKWSAAGYSPPEVGVRFSVFDNRTRVNTIRHVIGMRSSLDVPKHCANFCVYGAVNNGAVNNSFHTLLKIPPLEFQFSPEFTAHIPGCAMFDDSEHILFLTRSGEDYVSAEYAYTFREKPPAPVMSFPRTLAFLSFYDYRDLEPTHLLLISSACPTLMQLDLQGCPKALSNLDGLSSIVTNCGNLSGLILSCQDDRIDVVSFWKILCQVNKLSLLTIAFCFLCPGSAIAIGSDMQQAGPFLQATGSRSRESHVRSQSLEDVLQIEQCLEKMVTLRALAVDGDSRCIVHRRRYSSDHLYILSKLKTLRYLRMCGTVLLTERSRTIKTILLSLHYLTSLTLHFSSFKLPDVPNCYKSLQHLSIHSYQFLLSNEVANALSHRKQLTHIDLTCICQSPECLLHLVCNSPCLVECHVKVTVKGQTRTSVKTLKASLKSELSKRAARHSLDIRAGLY